MLPGRANSEGCRWRVEGTSENVSKTYYLLIQSLAKMLINGNISERPREKVVSRYHACEMPDDDFEQLKNAGASFHMREVQVGDEAQDVQDDTLFLHQHRRG
jgi:hypothetical protein